MGHSASREGGEAVERGRSEFEFVRKNRYIIARLAKDKEIGLRWSYLKGVDLGSITEADRHETLEAAKEKLLDFVMTHPEYLGELSIQRVP